MEICEFCGEPGIRVPVPHPLTLVIEDANAEIGKPPQFTYAVACLQHQYVVVLRAQRTLDTVTFDRRTK